MKCCAFPLLALALMASTVFGRIGDTSAEFKNRYGDPIADSFDKEGYGICIYRSPEFKEIRVIFAQDKSQQEYYTPAEGVPDKETLYRRLRTENGEDYGYVNSEGQLKIGFGESDRELKFVRGDGVTRTYAGNLEIKKKGNQEYAVVHDDTAVLEMPLAPFEAEAAAFRSGLNCKITLLHRFPDDLWAPTAWIGKREHLDDQDMRDDAHDQLQTLVSIESDGKRIYDRSFCSVHQVAMELRSVNVAFGMLAFPSAERYCQEHFPHYRDFGIGGCVMSEGDENKTIQIYICPACVKACNEYKAAHPESPGH
jgi:hypothetical protein